MSTIEEDDAAEENGVLASWRQFLETPFSQIVSYSKYVTNSGGFDTHHGVKGLLADLSGCVQQPCSDRRNPSKSEVGDRLTSCEFRSHYIIAEHSLNPWYAQTWSITRTFVPMELVVDDFEHDGMLNANGR